MKYKVIGCTMALLVLSFQMFAQDKGKIVNMKAANQRTNYSIIPKLPPPTKPEGVYILNGTESSTLRAGGYDKPVSWDADIKGSGKQTGFLIAKDVKFRITSMSSGTIQAELGTHKIDVDLAKGLPTGVPGELR